MKELLTFGDVENDFTSLNVVLRQTYKGKDYGVCEVTDKEYTALCNEPDDIDAAWWDRCGWRYSEGSTQDEPNHTFLINGKELNAWKESEEDDYSQEKFSNLLEYLNCEMDCGQPRNICALAKDLAKYNNMKLNELFQKYQG